jgi:dolichyldiphosphatase
MSVFFNSPIAALVDRCTKWAVSLTVMATVAVEMGDGSCRAAFFVMGALGNAVVTKIAKKILKAPRPAQGDHEDILTGMPSSHASSLFFLATGAAWAAGYPRSVFLVTTAAYLTSLRVTLGHHTWPQVIVGGVLGGINAALWLRLETWLGFFGPTDSQLSRAVNVTFVLITVVAWLTEGRRWVRQLRRR